MLGQRRFRLLVPLLLAGVSCGTERVNLIPLEDAAGGRDRALDRGGTDAPLDGGADGPVDLGPGCQQVEQIVLAPRDSELLLDSATPPAVQFTVTAVSAAGDEQPVEPEAVTWSVTRADDTAAGEIVGGRYAPHPDAGGTVTVSATYCGRSSATTLTLRLDRVVGTPVDAAAWESPVVEGPAAVTPAIVYPSDQTRFPRNVPGQLLQWQTAGHTEFRLTYQGSFSRLVVYTDGLDPTCAGQASAGCFDSDATSFGVVAASQAGSTSSLTVEALDRGGPIPVIRRSAPVELGFSRRDIRGAIFYWSTTAAGIRRASLSSTQAEPYLVGKPTATRFPDGDQIKCVACHTVSRDGRYLLAPVESTGGKSLWIAEITASAPPNPLVRQVEGTDGHGFATISPDNAWVVGAWGGGLSLIDRASGAVTSQLDLGGLEATHPDWSPDGSQLVFATRKGDAPGGAGLAVVPWDGSAFGEPTVLVPADGASNLFPMFSFDGELIAYARGRGGHGDEEAQLWVVGKDGQRPVELRTANRVNNNEMTDGRYQNSQPTWAPAADLGFVAFNSLRPYGLVSEAGTQQLWVAGVQTDRVAAGEDGSYPAFRLPAQGLNENNHRAFWTLDVREPAPVPDGGPGDGGPGDGGGADARACLPLGRPCDPLLDSCCDEAAYCDSQDDGLTYSCVQLRPQG